MELMRIQTKRISIYLRFVMLALCGGLPASFAADHLAPDRISDISNTKHNFAANATVVLPGGKQRQVRATTQNETCVFCHTPHGLPSENEPFLWNRDYSAASSYSFYDSSSMDAAKVTSATAIGKPTKMCLSCHDGTVAVGAIKVVNGKAAADVVAMTGDDGLTAGGALKDSPTGHGNYSLGVDLTNDHPISFVYDSALTTADGELVDPTTTDYIGVRVGASVASHNQSVTVGTPTSLQPTASKTRIAVPLDSALASGKLDALAANTFATLQSSGMVECTSCHDPHIRSTNADENIKFLRLHRFQKVTPSGGAFNIASDQNCLACHKKAAWHLSVHANATDATAIYDTKAAGIRDFPAGTKVWEAGCLSCHDTHTENGAKLLLREGADSSGSSAREEACYQCHSSTDVLQTAAKDIQTVVASSLAPGHTVTTSDTHDVVKKGVIVDNFAANAFTANGSGNHIEKQTNLQNANRHVECSDCHHPHRIVRNTKFDGTGSAGSANHDHSGAVMHTNTASGAIRGAWGVEPVYGATAWGSAASSFNVLQGDASDTASYTGSSYVNKEYQVCLKCHSTYSNSATATDQAMQFQPAANVSGNNHRSWHPVLASTTTGSHPASAINTTTLESPFNFAGSVGNQTMLCSDCHSNSDANGAKGPHGSANQKLLMTTGDSLCLACHKTDQYKPATAGAASASPISGFSCAAAADCKAANGTTNSAYRQNLHIAHSLNDAGYSCDQCHVKIPHGWENKALLVNKATRAADSVYYTANAKLKMTTIRASGQWIRSASGANDDCTDSGCHSIP